MENARWFIIQKAWYPLSILIWGALEEAGYKRLHRADDNTAAFCLHLILVRKRGYFETLDRK